MAGNRINHRAVWLLVVVQQLLSFAWYSPYLFGFKWINLAGYRLSAVPPADTVAFYKPFLISICASALVCYGLAVLFKRLNVTCASRGVILASGCWIAFSFSPLFTHNEFANRPWALTLIDAGRDWIIFVSAGLVLAKWRLKAHYETE
ncbi:MAG TPA: DUF1761 domain-containing protein [Gammaproteobacteria bacterium]